MADFHLGCFPTQSKPLKIKIVTKPLFKCRIYVYTISSTLITYHSTRKIIFPVRFSFIKVVANARFWDHISILLVINWRRVRINKKVFILIAILSICSYDLLVYIVSLNLLCCRIVKLWRRILVYIYYNSHSKIYLQHVCSMKLTIANLFVQTIVIIAW